MVDRLKVNPAEKKRLADSLETALKIGQGTAIINHEGQEELFSQNYACASCGISYAEVQPRNFSFNSPYGACPGCNGLGVKVEFDLDFIIPDRDKAVIEAIEPWKRGGRGYIMYYKSLFREACRSF